MSALPTTISIPTTVVPAGVLPAPTTIGRAYGELAEGLRELAEALRRGDGVIVAGPRPAFLVVPAPAPAPTGGAASQMVATMAVEVVKTGLVVLAVYQGLLTLLPAPERPRFAPVPSEASPAAAGGLPSVVATAAPAAAGGQLREVEAHVDGRSRFTAAP